QAADVVATQSGTQDCVPFEQEPCQALEASVCLPFVRENRNRPTLLSGGDGFVVPIRALYEPHPDRCATLQSPVVERLEIGLTLLQIGLDGNADVLPIPKGVFQEDVAEDLQGEVFVSELLHIKVDKRPDVPCSLQDWPEPGADGSAGAQRIHWIELTIERRELDRDVGTGQGAKVISINEIDRRPAPHLLADASNEVEIFRLVALGFGFGNRCLAEEIDRESQRATAQGGDRFENFGQVGTGDETSSKA